MSRQTGQLNLTILSYVFKVNFFIVDAEILILLGNDILHNSLHVTINMENKTLSFKDRSGKLHTVDMITLTSGHYAIKLNLTNLYVDNDQIFHSKEAEDVQGRGRRGPEATKTASSPEREDKEEEMDVDKLSNNVSKKMGMSQFTQRHKRYEFQKMPSQPTVRFSPNVQVRKMEPTRPKVGSLVKIC